VGRENDGAASHNVRLHQHLGISHRQMQLAFPGAPPPLRKRGRLGHLGRWVDDVRGSEATEDALGELASLRAFLAPFRLPAAILSLHPVSHKGRKMRTTGGVPPLPPHAQRVAQVANTGKH
jgi:hypothetical protein